MISFDDFPLVNMKPERKSWLLRFSNWLTDDLIDRYGVFGIIPLIAVGCLGIFMFGLLVATILNTVDKPTLRCEHGHFEEQHNVKTGTHMYFVCDSR